MYLTEEMLRERQALVRLGLSHGPFWKQQKDGLLPRPVKMSARTSRWPASEIAAVIAARIAGKSEEEIRTLVSQIEAKRKQLQPA